MMSGAHYQITASDMTSFELQDQSRDQFPQKMTKFCLKMAFLNLKIGYYFKEAE